MADLPEPANPSFPEGIYQLETTDPVLGGVPNEQTRAGLANLQAFQLWNGLRWFKAQWDALLPKLLTTDNSPRLMQQNGHFRLGAGGPMVQFGRGTFDAGVTAISFPTPFPTACLVVVPGDMSGGGTEVTTAHPVTVIQSSITRTGFSGFGRFTNNDTFAPTLFSYIAIGH